jgi:hypothetical protein
MKSVFISHIGLDTSLALALKRWIELVFKRKCGVFVSGSFTDIEPGAVWAMKLRESLTNAKVLLVICTRKSINSGWVLFEAGSSWGRNVPILPICCEPHLELPVLLGTNQLIYFSDPDFSKTLIGWLTKKLNLSSGKPAYGKMELALRQAYESCKMDADIIDRIKDVRMDRSLRVKECTPGRLAAHFDVETADVKARVETLEKKGYLKRNRNKLTGPYYSLTPKSERLLL